MKEVDVDVDVDVVITTWSQTATLLECIFLLSIQGRMINKRYSEPYSVRFGHFRPTNIYDRWIRLQGSRKYLRHNGTENTFSSL